MSVRPELQTLDAKLRALASQIAALPEPQRAGVLAGLERDAGKTPLQRTFDRALAAHARLILLTPEVDAA